MDDGQLAVFVQLICNYFTHSTRCSPQLGSPSIEFGTPRLLDYTGFIRFSGSSPGWIYISFTRPMAKTLLTRLGEQQQDSEMIRDAVGEIASIVTSNAREHFGSSFRVSLPIAISKGEDLPIPDGMPQFAYDINWESHKGILGIVLGPDVPALQS
ncbi:MAG: chemotaxis protein CheX [Candidatus Methylacidiphilales bacterium]|nr:chemotaxis protein CheX [Candidatus Methylacidiphilales bacterium]